MSKFIKSMWMEVFILVSEFSDNNKPESVGKDLRNINPMNLRKKELASFVLIGVIDLDKLVIRRVVIKHKPCKIRFAN